MADTIPALLLGNIETRPDKPAIREKLYGIWETWNWRSYGDNVRDLAFGLRARGFGKGDKLAVIGDNRPHLYWAQMAAMCLGGSAVPVYQDSIARELAFVLNHAEVKVVVAEDQEQADKILSIRDELPSLELLVYSDPRGMMDYDEDILLAFAALQEEGRAAGGDFAAICGEVAPEDIALMCYTSGTTGRPKGVMLSHANLVQAARIYCSAEDLREGDDFLAYLPMAWVGDSMYGLVASLLVGSATNCPGKPGGLAPRPARARADGHHRRASPLGDHALRNPGAGRGFLHPQAARLRLFPRCRRAGGELPHRGAAGSGRPGAPLSAGRVPGLWPGARPVRPAPGALGAHRRRAARPGHLPLLSAPSASI